MHAALGFLNARTPHRYTGIYRFDGDYLRNEFLFDQYDAAVRRGEDALLRDTWCGLIDESGTPVSFDDARGAGLAQRDGGRVQSYCGVPIVNEDGQRIGTLCHFDEQPCEARVSDLAMLQAVAPLVLAVIEDAESR